MSSRYSFRCCFKTFLIRLFLMIVYLEESLPSNADISTRNPDTDFSRGNSDPAMMDSVSPAESFTWSEIIDAHCPSNADCSDLSGDCIDCAFNFECIYGEEETVTCTAKPGVICNGPQQFEKTFTCQYCYQTPRWQQTCTNTTGCNVVAAPLEYYQANCSVHDDVICLGRRKFYRMQRCNWTSGKRWSTVLAYSITLGGFGADRFYLGHWQAGIGKLFSLGGLGLWTIVDVILVGTGYVGPADGSLYIT